MANKQPPKYPTPGNTNPQKKKNPTQPKQKR